MALTEEPIWKRYYDLECQLNMFLKPLFTATNRPKTAEKKNQILQAPYNPVEYAAQVHCLYLQRFIGNSTKRLLIVGENPGLKGMTQNGVSKN